MLLWAWKCVFYIPEHNAKGDHIELNSKGLEMQKWNRAKDRAQRVDDKNGVISLIIMFIPRFMVVKHLTLSCIML